MSRGLGTRQKAILRALLSLEQEGGEGFYRVWSIVDRVFDLCPDLHALEAARKEESEAFQRQLVAEAKAGDAVAREMLRIAALLRSTRSYRGREKRRQAPIGEELNPSRTLKALEQRGLVKRLGGPGDTAAALTDAGRQAALSVGSICGD